MQNFCENTTTIYSKIMTTGDLGLITGKTTEQKRRRLNLFCDLILIDHCCINSDCLSVACVLDGDLLSRLNLEITDTWERKPAFVFLTKVKLK